MSHKLAVITVVYQNYDVLQDFFKSLSEQTDKNFHLYIADLSRDKKHIDPQPFEMTVIPADNKGYAYGANIGQEKASQDGFDQFCIMNNDTYFHKEFIAEVKKGLAAHPRAIVTGKIYYAPGYEYHKDRYSKHDLGNVIWYAGGTINWHHVITPHRGVDEVDKGQWNEPGKITFTTGCLIAYDRHVADVVGPWDISYFLYYEDADFSVRALKKDIDIYYEPHIVIWHKNAQSTEGAGSNIHTRYQTKNRLKFGMKYAPLRTKLHLIKNAMLGQLSF